MRKCVLHKIRMKEIKNMLKCKICGCEFNAVKERHYISRDNGKIGLTTMFGSNPENRLYDTFDCPVCGCQIVAQERKSKYDLRMVIIK